MHAFMHACMHVVVAVVVVVVVVVVAAPIMWGSDAEASLQLPYLP